MTDEPREENRPDEEEVEGHGWVGPLPDEKHESDEDDVEAHGFVGPEPTKGGFVGP